ncbi:MAG: complex I subunit 5 family protein [Spirochaetaceae bacterium]
MSFLPDIPLHVFTLFPVTSAAIGFFLPRKWFHLILIVTQTAAVLYAVDLFIEVRWGQGVFEHVAGWPGGIAIRLVADNLSIPLVLLVTVFCAGAFLFSTRAVYMDNTFLFLVLLLESAMLGVFLSGDLFNIYVLFELGMLCIAILIMYKRDKQSVYDGIFYIMMNFIAMAFMLLGIGYIYRMTGTLDLQILSERLALVEDPSTVIVPYALIMTAIALKAALLPLFGWLPRAHGAPSAPSIVSAILSGVQVKVGVYLLIRLQAVFLPVADASTFFAVLGFVTSIVGFSLAVAQKDIKLILAYHTVSQVGLIVMGLNMGTETAYWGGMMHIINHAFFKGLLFLSAGVIIEEYGTRSYTEIRGVFRRMPVVGIATLAGVLGITGAPFFNGSISKYFIESGLEGNLWPLGMYLINFGTTLSFVKYSTILFGKSTAKSPPGRDPFVAGVSLLFGLVCLAGGLFGSMAVELLFGYSYDVPGAYSLTKVFTFVATLALAVAAYVVVVPRMSGFLSRIREYRFNFNQVTVFLTSFFVVFVGYLWFQ